MPADYFIDDTHHLIRSHAWGTLTDDDILRQQAQLRADPKFNPSLHQLVDLREVGEVAVSLETVKQLGQSTLFTPASRRAYVVRQNVLYGMVRMYEIYQNLRGSLHVRAFRDHDEALRWLGLAGSAGHDARRSA